MENGSNTGAVSPPINEHTLVLFAKATTLLDGKNTISMLTQSGAKAVKFIPMKVSACTDDSYTE